MKTKLVWVLFAILFFQCKSRQAGRGDSTLENTYWKLVEADGQAIATPANAREVHMTLTSDGDKRMLKGHAGCNGLGGDFTLEGEKIKFQAITTRMFCEAQMEVENLFTRMLTDADNYRIEGKTLELYKGDALLGKFEAKPAE